MAATAPKLFVTGDPGCGKTTLLRRVIDRLAPSVPMRGFVVREIVEDGKRAGFEGLTLDGSTFPLAHRDFGGSMRVGPYGVRLEGLETVGLDSLRSAKSTRLVVLDEVGKMESFSILFREAVESLLEGDVAVLGTVAAHGVGFPKSVRHDPRVTLVTMSRASRAGTLGDVLRRLGRAGIAPAERAQQPRPPARRRAR